MSRTQQVQEESKKIKKKPNKWTKKILCSSSDAWHVQSIIQHVIHSSCS